MADVKPAAAVAVLFLALVGCGGAAVEDGALARGDEAWARGDADEALAEYRLALRGEESGVILARVAHAYAELGRVDEAGEHFRRAIAADPALADQAVADLVRIARAAQERRDRYTVATAVQLAMELQPGIGVGELALPLAREYALVGDFDQALPLFRRALSSMSTEEAGPILYEVGQAYEGAGDCARALTYYEQFSRHAPRALRGEVSWHIGNCAFQLGQELRANGRLVEGLRYLRTMLDVGEPKNLRAQAYFEVGEILSQEGECSAALDAFRSVLREEGSRNGPLVARAEQRIDELRFGRPGGAPEGRC